MTSHRELGSGIKGGSPASRRAWGRIMEFITRMDWTAEFGLIKR
jgi:hypothetical protein